MGRIAAQTKWTITDDDGGVATIEIVNDDEDGPRLEIEQGDDRIYMGADAVPQFIAALQAAIAVKP